jgi:O-succinylbenzoate synthase
MERKQKVGFARVAWPVRRCGVSHLFQFRRYRLPFRGPLRTAHGPWSEREGVLVQLTDATGHRGYGEASPIPWFGTETTDEVEAACRELGEKVDEARLAAVPARLGCLRNALAVAREPAGRWTPLHKNLSVAALLPAGRAAAGLIAAKADAGFRVFKWKVGVEDVADELVLLDDVCAALPEGAKLRLDANGAWDRRRAERWLERCADRPVEFIEQPIAADARGAADVLLGLAGDFPTPLALDESITGESDIERWLGAGWPGVFVVKPALLADVGAALDRLAKAKAAVVFSSALETRVGAKAALRAAFCWAGETGAKGAGQTQAISPRALGFGVWPLFADARFDGPYQTPFLRWEDVERMDPEAVWNALS